MFVLNKQSIGALQSVITNLEGNSVLQGLRTRFEIIDKYIARESSLHQEAIQGQAANRAGNKKAIPDVEAPVCLVQVETALAYYTSIFVTGYPMFGVVGKPKQQAGATMMAGLIARDQTRFGWQHNFIKAFRDVCKYNLGAVEVTWTKKRGTVVKGATQSGSAQTGVHSSVIYQGNRIRRLDPYNIFFDSSVEPTQVHEHGQHVGYIERYNYINLKTFVADLDGMYLVKSNLSTIFREGVADSAMFKRPQIRRDNEVPYDPNDFSQFFGFHSPNKGDKGAGKYEVITAYVRIIPKEFFLNVPKAGQPQVFKLIWVNKTLIYAEPINSGHEYLPIILLQGTDEGLNMETKSLAENVMPFQDLVSTMLNATQASLRRAVSDRALYNPLRIKPTDINSPHPQAKIPVSFTSYDQSFSDAYAPIPFNDTVTPSLQSNLQVALSLADQAAGTNRAAQGNFVKGNRTLFEYDNVMQNMQARLQLSAISLQNTGIVPIQQILKINYLMYAVGETIIDPKTNETVDIDPTKLREQEAEFTLSDGLVPSSKIINSELLNTAIGAIGQVPELARDYKVGDMLQYLLKMGGLTNMDDFKRSPEEQKEYDARVAAAAGAAQQNTR